MSSYAQFVNLPKHIAIITDGNGRWASRRGLPRSLGHKAGVKPIKKITQVCLDLGIENLTWYAFSTENWKRSNVEVDFLMKLFIEFFREWREEIVSKGLRFKHIGLKDNLPEDLVYEIKRTEELTAKNNKMLVSVALNYSGREEIVNATRSIIMDIVNRQLNINDIDEDLFGGYLWTKDQVDPDLLIRTSGEERVSNFLLWQLSKTQIWTANVLWPDFTSEHLLEAINSYWSQGY